LYTKAFFICWVFCLLWSVGNAQLSPIDTFEMEQVTVVEKRMRGMLVGSQVQRWKKEDLEKTAAGDLSQLLEREAGVYIKHYGAGTLSTVSIRGSGSSQTAFLWNGMPLSSPTLGLLDLSLIPISGFDQIEFQKGSNGSLWGSGAIGGNLQLNNEFDSPVDGLDKKFGIQSDIALSKGSFGFTSLRAEYTYGGKKLYARTKAQAQNTNNNYSFQRAPALPFTKLDHARQEGQHLTQDIVWEINRYNRLQFNYWRSEFTRDIPPTIVQNESQAIQYDLSNRAMLRWEHENSFGNLITKVGVIDEYNDFEDNQIGLVSSNYFQNLFAESAMEKHWNSNELLFGFSYFNTKANTASYSIGNSEYRTAIFSSYTQKIKNLVLQGSLRAELFNGSLVPIIPSIGAAFVANDHLQIKARLARNYRLPTMNDRFWKPGGNINLLPESGWSQELSMNSYFNKKSGYFELSITGFNRQVENWIIWALDSNTNFFASQNLAKVWSRGLESKFITTIDKNNHQFRLGLQYDLIFSTNEKTIISPNIPEGSQLWYTPRHQGNISLDWNFKTLNVNYRHQFTGATQGINEAIDGYHLGNLRINFTKGLSLSEKNPKRVIDIRKLLVKFHIQINNLWNNRYFVIERRPLPGINGQIGFTTRIN